MKILLMIFLSSVIFAQSYTYLDISYRDMYQTLTNIQHQYLESPQIDSYNALESLELAGGLYTFRVLELYDTNVSENLDRIDLSIFMLTNVQQNYLDYYKPNKKNNSEFYKMVFKNVELNLLSMARESLKKRSHHQLLNTKYNTLIQYVSVFPFPEEYGFYRRRMMYSIETKESALQEIDRLHQSLVNLK